jgi:hypothetical protein
LITSDDEEDEEQIVMIVTELAPLRDLPKYLKGNKVNYSTIYFHPLQLIDHREDYYFCNCMYLILFSNQKKIVLNFMLIKLFSD